MIFDSIIAANLGKTADEQWRLSTQGAVDSAWENSTQVKTVQEQSAIGSDTYNSIEVQMLESVDFSMNNYFRTSDNVYKLVFRDITKQVIRGLYYYFDNNYWLSTYRLSSDTPQRYCYVVRCDATIRLRDPVNNQVLEFPAKLYEAWTPDIDMKNKNLIPQKSKMNLMTQLNTTSHRIIDTNKRIVIGSNVYRIIGIEDGRDDGLLYIRMEISEPNVNDDFENGIAWNPDEREQPAQVILTPAFDKLRVGQKMHFIGQCDNWEVTAESLSPNIAVYEDTTESDKENKLYKWIAEGVLKGKGTIRLHVNATTPFHNDFEIRVVSPVG